MKDNDLIKYGGLGCLGLFLLTAVCGGAALFITRRVAHDEASSDAPSSPSHPATRAADPSDNGPAKPTAPSHDWHESRTWTRPFHVKDRRHADVTELIPDAVALAHELQPGAKLYGVDAFQLHNGTMDIDGEHQASFEFEFGGKDPSQPPGKDKIEVVIRMRVGDKELIADASPHGAMHLDSDFFGRELDARPGCTAVKAFEAAVATGVPGNAIGRLIYEDAAHNSGGKTDTRAKGEWSLRVDGHDEYRREIDANTCEITKNWDPSAPKAASGGAKSGGHKHKH
ncbi:MAG TPA: hypothetical protein VGM56_14770 [Byssovorax sp.]|jgi:hypothetical protein